MGFNTVLKGLIDVSLKILAVRYEFCMTVFTASRHPRLALVAAQGARREGGGQHSMSRRTLQSARLKRDVIGWACSTCLERWFEL